MIDKDEIDDVFLSLAMNNKLLNNEELYEAGIDDDYYFNLTDDTLWKIEAYTKNKKQ